MMKIQNKKSSKKRIVPLVIIGIVLIGAAVAAWIITTQNAKDNSGINYNPPTQEQKDAGQQTKEDNNKPQTGTDGGTAPDVPTGSDGKKSVTPTIVDAGNYGQNVEVRALVPGVTESDGTCTAELTQGSQKVSKSSAATASASSTQCAMITISQAEFSSKGTWSLVVTYSSKESSGRSTPRDVSIN